MIFHAICLDVFRHAWRMKIPVVFMLIMVLFLLTLPSFLSTDGSAEGAVRIFHLYSGYAEVFILSFMAISWTIWLEHYEKQHKVHWMLAVKPVSRLKVLAYRIIANFLMIMLFFFGISLTVSFISSRLIASMKLEPGQRVAMQKKMSEVRTNKPLTLISDSAYETKRIHGKTRQALEFTPGQTVSFSVDLSRGLSSHRIKGFLVNHSFIVNAILEYRFKKGNETLLRKKQRYRSGDEFFLQIPEALTEHSPLTLDIRQFNKTNYRLYYLQERPFTISSPKGSLSGNYLRATLKMSCLCLVLVSVSMFFSQILSIQGSFLVVTCFYITGFFKSSISKIVLGDVMETLPNPDWQTQAIDVFYQILWRPLLLVIPDFSELNPTLELVDREFISIEHLWRSWMNAWPTLFLLFILLAMVCKRREPAFQE